MLPKQKKSLKMAYYKNTDRYSNQHGHIVEFNDIDTVYNVYGCFVESDNSDPEDEDSQKFIAVVFDDCYCDESGRFLNSQVFSHGVSQVWYGGPQKIYMDSEGKEEFDPTTSGDRMDLYIYWNGHNWVAETLCSETGESEWELVDDFNEDNVVTISEGEWNHGNKESICLDEKNGVFYKRHLSQWQGSFDSYEEFDDVYEIIPALRELDKIEVNDADYDDEEKQQEVGIVQVGSKFIVYDYCLSDNGNNEYEIAESEQQAKEIFNRLNSAYEQAA